MVKGFILEFLNVFFSGPGKEFLGKILEGHQNNLNVDF